MDLELQQKVAPLSLSERVAEFTDVESARCYQCGKCSAGCPLSAEMDYPPSVILHMLQRDEPYFQDRILRSFTIWLCLTCEMCYARCPMEIDIPKLMDYLRQESLRQKKVNPRAKDIIRFHRSFLDSIEQTGRLYEIGLIADYKARSKHLFQDVSMAPKMLAKGKLPLFPELIKDRSGLSRIFHKTLKKVEGKP
jgi:heterodisulfide reductase subunit C